MIAELANRIYTPENIARAEVYLRSRYIKPELLRFPAALTSEDTTPFRDLNKKYIPRIFTERIYLPIVDFEDPQKLVGFDARYCGTSKDQIRFLKFKTDNMAQLMYFSHNLDTIRKDQPLIVTEGFIDAETLRELGHPVISPLTALHSLKFCLFLRAISNNIYFAYDNDESGKKAANEIKKEIMIEESFRKCFKFLNYSGKDLNECVKIFGKDFLFQILKRQIN